MEITPHPLPVSPLEALQPNRIGRAANQAASRPAEVRDPKLWKAACDFEAIFVRQLLEVMRAASPKDGFLEEENSTAREIYDGLFDKAVADNASASGSLGLALSLYRQLAPSGAMR
ncbi:MAG TPA: rod-binding protein [Candidatus Brocadiia bacterium]|nr:rod-binding protein [Candidatus Brocadiia bacterium]